MLVYVGRFYVVLKYNNPGKRTQTPPQLTASGLCWQANSKPPFAQFKLCTKAEYRKEW